MSRKRLSGEDRRSSIIEAATEVFAKSGFDGAKTQQIAAAANVSEALVYRHFPSKVALFRAVLRNQITNQDRSFEAFGTQEPTAHGLVEMLERTFRVALFNPAGPGEHNMRILFASLAGDGRYARLLYHRAYRMTVAPLQKALDAARQAGALSGPPTSATNLAAFIEHVASMMLIVRVPDRHIVDYQGSPEAIPRDAVLFCGQGLGLAADFIEHQLRSKAVPSTPTKLRERGSGKSGDEETTPPLA